MCYTMLYCTVPCRAVLYCMILYRIDLHGRSYNRHAVPYGSAYRRAVYWRAEWLIKRQGHHTIYHTTSHHTASHCFTSHHITSHHITRTALQCTALHALLKSIQTSSTPMRSSDVDEENGSGGARVWGREERGGNEIRWNKRNEKKRESSYNKYFKKENSFLENSSQSVYILFLFLKEFFSSTYSAVHTCLYVLVTKIERGVGKDVQWHTLPDISQSRHLAGKYLKMKRLECFYKMIHR